MANIIHRILDPFSLSKQQLYKTWKNTIQENKNNPLRVKQERMKLSCKRPRNMRCFHCFVTNKTLTDLKVKPLDKGSHTLSLEEIVLVKKENRIC
jgi:hypothetical protein